MKPKGLFLNTARARCSIYESGRMVFEAMVGSDVYDLDYQEVDFDHREVSCAYAFYVFNYHDTTSMSWLDTRCIRELPGTKIAIVLEVAPNNPFVRTPPNDFDAYVVLDPTVARLNSTVYPFPRPLEMPPAGGLAPRHEHPVIGTFGLPTNGKGFDRIVDAVNDEFVHATVRMNIPPGDYIVEEQRQEVEAALDTIRRRAKPGIELAITREFKSKPELIQWCSDNTLNVFLYDRAMAGLAATTDQAISSGRALAISTNETFRHIHRFVPPYPFRSLKESIALSEPEVAQMREAWSKDKFRAAFETLLRDFRREDNGTVRADRLTLSSKVFRQSPVARLKYDLSLKSGIPPVVPRLLRRFRRRFLRASGEVPLPSMTPFSSPFFASFSQHGEDIWLDSVLKGKSTGFYIDIGANHPEFNSNTCRFYRRGWTGINVEPTVGGHAAFQRLRPRDINLQIAVAPEEGETTLYTLSHDTTLSTLSRAAAEEAARRLGLAIHEVKVRTMPLQKIFEKHAAGRVVDFMSVDAEGYDIEVLRTNSWEQNRPTFVLVELNQNRNGIVQLLQRNDYCLLINNHVNGLFVDAASSSPLVRDVLSNTMSNAAGQAVN
jgi:FkbM family methyltransferase